MSPDQSHLPTNQRLLDYAWNPKLHLRQSSTFLCSSIDTSTYPLPTEYSRSIPVDILFSSLRRESYQGRNLTEENRNEPGYRRNLRTGSLKKKNMRYSMIEAINAIFFPLLVLFRSHALLPFPCFLLYLLYLFLILYLYLFFLINISLPLNFDLIGINKIPLLR